MKHLIVQQLRNALVQIAADHSVNVDIDKELHIERTKDRSHGDFASNVALKLAKPFGQKPRDLAANIVAKLGNVDLLRKVEIAGPGFINFHLSPKAYHDMVTTILSQQKDFGTSTAGAGKKIQVEFVSANPTGPLHVGHGRGAACGSVVANLLNAVGFNVTREYYINDAGRQMDILATSVWLRYLELCGEAVVFPSNGYKGEYIREISHALREKHADEFRHAFSKAVAGAAVDLTNATPDGDKEAHIDDLISNAKKLLGKAGYRAVFGAGLNAILQDIKEDLEEFGVTYDEWFSEESLMEIGAVQRMLDKLKASNHVYEKDGAFWFRSTDFGDEKDRVVARDNGQTTYFASDIAYHMNKIERGFDKIVDIWGADHHGYVPRVKASINALGFDASVLDVVLVQFAVLYRGSEKVQMSTRSGEFVTLRQLRDEVGRDATRFFYIMRKSDQHLDFDLDLAKSRSNENPVYYIQYAHARICSVFREAEEKALVFDQSLAEKHLALLDSDHEQALLVNLSRYPEIVESAALNYEPHQIPHYLRDLANDFHAYYNAHKFIVDDVNMRNARFALIRATRQVMRNGLDLIGVSAPEAM